MREIKFRAWDGEEMVDGQLFSISMDGSLIVDTGECGDKYLDWPVMQYTGLKDKNGKEIYEGDLLQVEGETGNYNIFEVFYHNNDCIGGQNIGFCINRMHPQGNSGGGRGYKFTPNSIRDNNLIVCGNIYENPELIQK